MTPMDANRVAWNIGGWKKGEPHDVIPMHMGHEEIIDLGCAGPCSRMICCPRLRSPEPISQTMYSVPPTSVHTRGVATVAVPDREIELFVDETLDRLVVGEASTVGVQEGLLNFVTYPCTGQGDRKEPRVPQKRMSIVPPFLKREHLRLTATAALPAADIPLSLTMIGDMVHRARMSGIP